jgi:hypothetical protein
VLFFFKSQGSRIRDASNYNNHGNPGVPKWISACPSNCSFPLGECTYSGECKVKFSGLACVAFVFGKN